MSNNKQSTPTSSAPPSATTAGGGGGEWTPTHEQMIQSQLSRNDLVQLIGNPDLAERILPGFFIRVLIELHTGAEDYRAYTVRRFVQGRPYSGFSNDRTATTNLYLELNTPSFLEKQSAAAGGAGGSSSTKNEDATSNNNNNINSSSPNAGNHTNSSSFQLNCISNSPISQHEYQLWVQEVLNDPIRSQGLQGFQERKSRSQELMPSLQGPSQRNRNRNNNNQNQQPQQPPQATDGGSNSNNNNNNNSADPSPASGGNQLNRNATVSNFRSAAGGGNEAAGGNASLNVTVRSSAGSPGGGDPLAIASSPNQANNGPSLAATVAGGASGNNNNPAAAAAAAAAKGNTAQPAPRHGSSKVNQDAAVPAEAVQEQLLAALKRNYHEEQREKFAVFTDPRLYPTSKLATLRTLENDLGDYIDKLREVVQAKKPTCVVCMTKMPSVVFLPCRHMALCRSCAVDLVSAKCPLCRETIVELWEPEEL